MNGEGRWRIRGLLIGAAYAALATAVRAEVQINFIVRDANNDPIPVIRAGDELLISIRLNVTGNDDPTRDVRLMQFDLRGTDPQLELLNFTWRLRATGLINESHYERKTNLATAPRATYTDEVRDPGYIVDLTSDFRVVARVQLIAHRSGTFNVTSTALSNPEDPSQGCWILAGFDVQKTFTAHNNTVRGGELFIEVQGDDGYNTNDNDSGGNQNRNDNAGNDNGSTNENKNDSGGNENENKNGNDNSGNANDNTSNDNIVDGERNVGPPAVGGFPCGMAMFGPALFLLMALTCQKRWMRRRGLGTKAPARSA